MKKNRENLFIFGIILCTTFVYLHIALSIHKSFFFHRTETSYYNDLITAFLHGRLYLEGQLTTHDLSFFEGKWYPYWGPAPVLFILPFYVVFGPEVSDVIYVLIAAVLGIVVFYFVLKECIHYFKLHVSQYHIVILLLGYSFVSPLWYLAVAGGIWHTSQVIGTLYLLLYLFCLFRFLNDRQYKYIVIAAVCFNLAWFTRSIFILTGLLFLLILGIKEKNRITIIKKSVLGIGVVTTVFISIFIVYNYARFHNSFETGLKFHRPIIYEGWSADDKARMIHFTELLTQGKTFGFEYIAFNVRHYFLQPAFIVFYKPYITMDKDGNSIFSIYPLLLLIVCLFKKQILQDKKRQYFLGVSCLIIFVYFAVLLTFVGRQWAPFGHRYILDIMPILYLMILLGIKYVRPHFILYMLLGYGILINLLGITYYTGLI